jgi:hypothetical protein
MVWQADRVLEVSGRLHWVDHETATPLKQATFHVVMCFIGRWCRTLVRRLLQRRLITGGRTCGVLHARRIAFDGTGGCEVIDHIKLLDDSLRIRRMAFASDLQAAYVAAANVYQESVLQPWADLSEHVDALNNGRRVSIVRSLR